MSNKTEDDIVEEMFHNLIDDEEDKNETIEPHAGEIHEETEQTEAPEKDAEVAQENAEGVGAEEEPESVEIAPEDNTEDPETQQEQLEDAVSETESVPVSVDDDKGEQPHLKKGPPRDIYNFIAPRRDLVFRPGTGGNFFATMIYDKIIDELVGVFGYDAKINEYEVKQSMSHQVIDKDTKERIVLAIRKTPHRLELIRNYLYHLQTAMETTEYDWNINRLNSIIEISHSLTYEDLKHVGLSDFLISKDTKKEIELMGKERAEEFYDCVHDLFYEHMNSDLIPYMTDLTHIPYHMNTVKPKDIPIHKYSYATILAHEQVMYTTMLRMAKHALRKKELGDSEVVELRDYVDRYLNHPIVCYEYVNGQIIQEMYEVGANYEKYAKHFYYQNMIVNPDDDKWAEFYDFFGYETYYWKNKNRLLDKVHEYHERNVELLSNVATKREIDFMLNPLKRIRGV